MSAAQEFLDRVVRPTVDDWLRSPLDERLAKQAANELNNLQSACSVTGPQARQLSTVP
jgi:hypothetical protein